jgi:hypothetical protein
MKVKNIGANVCTIIGGNSMRDVRPGEVVDIDKVLAAPYLSAGVFEEVVHVSTQAPSRQEQVRPEPARESRRYRAEPEVKVSDLGESDEL